ncbi:MAG: NmrA family NAD(P)-binding protein [Terriglobus roseus]|nr:NmrA family NAD(P)-binding protein [Terriglobus roseus]
MKLPGWRVRGITRNPSGASAKKYADQGAELVKGDLDDEASLARAFAGAHAIFSVTDFWQHFSNPANAEKARNVGRTINEYAYDLEVAQGLRIARAAASAEVAATLERFVFSSLSEARRWSGGKYEALFHFDGKAEVVNRIRSAMPGLAARMSCVQIGHYVTNWKGFDVMAPKRQPDGSYLVLKPEPAETQVPFVCTQRDTGAFVKALVLDLPPGKTLLGVSEFMTWPEWMRLWGDHLGVKAGFAQVPMEEFLKNVPEALKAELSQSYQYAAEFGWDGGDPDVMRVEDVSDRPFKLSFTVTCLTECSKSSRSTCHELR